MCVFVCVCALWYVCVEVRGLHVLYAGCDHNVTTIPAVPKFVLFSLKMRFSGGIRRYLGEEDVCVFVCVRASVCVCVCVCVCGQAYVHI